MFIHRVCQAFQDERIPYAVVGGYAVALHGAMRGTVDVDVVINWSLENLQKVANILRRLGLVSRLPLTAELVFSNLKEYVENRNLIGWNFYNPLNQTEQVDIIITYDLAHASSETIHTNSGDISILSKNDLIKMKRKSGRPQDLEDVHALEAL